MLLFDPESGKMKCNQCGQYEEKRAGLRLKEDPDDENASGNVAKNSSGSKTKEEGATTSRSFEELWYGFRAGQKWHGEEEINVNPAWDADILLEENKDDVQEAFDDKTTYMEVNIFRCTSCGAKLIINKNETATFCAHCGQPTVVFDKVSEEAQPDYIIPFKITEKQAVNLIKAKFGKGFFVPDEIKNLEIDKVRGIYVPYWLYTVYIRKKANLKKTPDDNDPEFNSYARKNNPLLTKGMYPGSISDQKRKKEYAESGLTVYGDKYVDTYGTFEKMGFDASRKLDNSLAEALDPFDMSGLQKFEPKLLSGFYADKYDVPSREAAPRLHKKISDAVNRDILDSTNCDTVIREIEQYSVDAIEYALMPVWFMTFWYKKKLYTVLVNGQTGKVVGNIPVRRDRMGYCFAISATILCMLMTFLSVSMGREILYSNSYMEAYGYSDIFSELMAQGIRHLIWLIGFAIVFFIGQYVKYKKYKADLEKLSGTATTKYVKERQDKTWVR